MIREKVEHEYIIRYRARGEVADEIYQTTLTSYTRRQAKESFEVEYNLEKQYSVVDVQRVK